ncbi:MAG: hypothetical protein NTZ05_05870, partial [Chloroflexi bacterium]|nr:hypothetical protein [Chloroflexota bacterium]
MQPKEIRRRILELIAEHENTDASTYVDDADLAVSLSISITQVQRQMDILEQEGLLKTANTFGSQSALLSPSGWRALEVEDHEPAPAPATFSTNIRSGIVQLVQNTGP